MVVEGRRLPCPPARSRFRVCAGAVPPGDIQDVFRSRQTRLYALHKLLHAHRFRLPRLTLALLHRRPASFGRRKIRRKRISVSPHTKFTLPPNKHRPPGLEIPIMERKKNNATPSRSRHCQPTSSFPSRRARARYPNSFYKARTRSSLPSSLMYSRLRPMGPSPFLTLDLHRHRLLYYQSSRKTGAFPISVIGFLRWTARMWGDTLWVRTLRRVILMHSEVLWERVKAVLGAPFDLDAVVRLPSASQTIQGGRAVAVIPQLNSPVTKDGGGRAARDC